MASPLNGTLNGLLKTDLHRARRQRAEKLQDRIVGGLCSDGLYCIHSGIKQLLRAGLPTDAVAIAMKVVDRQIRWYYRIENTKDAVNMKLPKVLQSLRAQKRLEKPQYQALVKLLDKNTGEESQARELVEFSALLMELVLATQAGSTFEPPIVEAQQNVGANLHQGPSVEILPPEAEKEVYTLSRLISEYRRNCELRYTHAQQRTIARHLRSIDTLLGHVPLPDLSPSHADVLCEMVLDVGADEVTATETMATLKQILRFAITTGRIESNPCFPTSQIEVPTNRTPDKRDDPGADEVEDFHRSMQTTIRSQHVASMVERERAPVMVENTGGLAMRDERTITLSAISQSLSYRYSQHLGCDDDATPTQMLDVIQFHDLLPESVCEAMREAIQNPREFDYEALNSTLLTIEKHPVGA